MKTKLILFLLALTMTVPFAQAKSKALKERKDGMHWQRYNSIGSTALYYQVDKQAQLCFAVYASNSTGSVANIDCAKLAKRSEWADIIDWLDNNSEAKPAPAPAAEPIPVPDSSTPNSEPAIEIETETKPEPESAKG